MIPKILAEIIGTFALVFIGAGSIILVEKFPQVFPPISIPLAFGFTIILMILAVGHISGAHFNPAVTLAFAATGRLPADQILIYWSSQFFGGLIAIGLLEVLKKI